MRCNAFICKEKLRRFPYWYIEFVKYPDGRVVRAHFRDRFARCPDLPVQEFRNYLADFPWLGAAEVASCEVLVTES